MSAATPPHKVDVLILGAGVIGLACAWELLRAGRSVVVVDQGRVGSGSSHGNCGTITPSHAAPLAQPGQIGRALKWMWQADAPLHIRPRLDPALWGWLTHFAGRCNWRDFDASLRAKAALLNASRGLLQEWVARGRLQCEFQASGTAYVFRDAAAFEQAQWLPPRLRAVGVTTQVLDAAATQALEPALAPGAVGAFHHPDDARLRPDQLVAELARVVVDAGGKIIEHAPVHKFEGVGKSLSAVTAGTTRYQAREVLLALGAWSAKWQQALKLRIPVQPGKGYSITYSRPAIAPKIPLVLRERGVCVTAWDSGFRLGSTMEFAGYDSRLNPVRLEALRRAAAEYLIEPQGPQQLEQWYGWRPMTWDDLPLLGRAPGYDNLWLATGHGMLGVSMCAISGQLICQMMQGESPALDVAPYAASRFG